MEIKNEKKQEKSPAQEQKDGQLQTSNFAAEAERRGPMIAQDSDENKAKSNSYTREDAAQRLASDTKLSDQERQKLENQTRVARGSDSRISSGEVKGPGANEQGNNKSEFNLARESLPAREQFAKEISIESKTGRVSEAANKQKLKEE